MPPAVQNPRIMSYLLKCMHADGSMADRPAAALEALCMSVVHTINYPGEHGCRDQDCKICCLPWRAVQVPSGMPDFTAYVRPMAEGDSERAPDVATAPSAASSTAADDDLDPPAPGAAAGDKRRRGIQADVDLDDLAPADGDATGNVADSSSKSRESDTESRASENSDMDFTRSMKRRGQRRQRGRGGRGRSVGSARPHLQQEDESESDDVNTPVFNITYGGFRFPIR